MTDSFQAHKDVMQFSSQARAMRSALVNRLFCTDVCCELVSCLHLLSYCLASSAKIRSSLYVSMQGQASELMNISDNFVPLVVPTVNPDRYNFCVKGWHSWTHEPFSWECTRQKSSWNRLRNMPTWLKEFADGLMETEPTSSGGDRESPQEPLPKPSPLPPSLLSHPPLPSLPSALLPLSPLFPNEQEENKNLFSHVRMDSRRILRTEFGKRNFTRSKK